MIESPERDQALRWWLAGFTMALSAEDRALVCEALDSHRYWQLSEEQFRNSGDIIEPGSTDPDNQEQIRACDALEDKLRKVDR